MVEEIHKVSTFLAIYAQHYTDVDRLYNLAFAVKLVSDRHDFEELMEQAISNPTPSLKGHIYTELRFSPIKTIITSKKGQHIGLIRWVK
jgi:hypothetical protein